VRTATRIGLTAALVAGAAFAGTGTASAGYILVGKCPDGYYGVVVDDHDVCTNLVNECPYGYDGIGVLGHNVCYSLRDIVSLPGGGLNS
jgi:hypothetical protein